MKKFLKLIKENKFKTVFISLSIIVVGLIISYAFFFTTKTSDPKIVTFGNISVLYTDGDIVNFSNSLPFNESNESDETLIYNYAPKKSFSVTNNGTVTSYLEISLTSINIDTSLQSEDFKWALYNSSEEKIATGNFKNITDGKIILKQGIKIDKDVTDNYKILFWIKDNGNNQNNMLNSTFNAKITVTAYSKSLKTVKNVILAANPVISNSPNFSTTSTDKGLFESTDDDGTTYYYRGAVENNYVQLGTYKEQVASSEVYANSGDPILWRIVRINGNGTIRLISQYNTGRGINWNSNGTSNYTNSTIKSEAENWYNRNIKVDNNIDNLIVAENFCNDISNSYSAANIRINNNNPIFACPSGANIINSKVGLITVDEMMYAGALGSTVTNNTTYLNNGEPFWTLSPKSSNTVFYFDSNSKLNTDNVSSNWSNFGYGTRPVINLKADSTIISGTGTKSDPYIIN